MSNSAITFHNLGAVQAPGAVLKIDFALYVEHVLSICCDYTQFTSSYFCSYKAITTHIGRSALCQTEGKGIYTVPVQYRPSGRAEDQEAGPVGADGAWPVCPAAPAAAPGKHIVCY
jgi:hypothetical protein